MNHLLSTVNPEAAAAIQPVPARQPLPGVGETVVYTMRQGFARNGRTRFPALVMGEQGGRLLLTVVVDAGDMVDESLVDEAGPGCETHCWERVVPSAPLGVHGTIAALHERIGALEDEHKQMRDICQARGPLEGGRGRRQEGPRQVTLKGSTDGRAR